ncbi:nuclease-related domain-containing protein [Aquipseudomonas alcaligenes]|uniref:Nuclease-related domain-containing protein n=1 Tax=Aquipseudomonas alcaligenes TaxID=43263 RepID=A0A1N6XEU0_AQUAC|nr:nuclease-related domain-containing protein [Pseudomonas alcaligenes]SIR00856.1 Nuclease-related domain-containing protein [Pseudomonas alcaligenes]
MTDFLWTYTPAVAVMFILGAIAHIRLLEYPKYRGWWGEYKVNFMLRLCLKSEYRVFANALYRGQHEGETTQVDHIVVSRYGVFVLETKSFKGRIVVDPMKPETWLQIVGRRKYEIRNPIYQNHAHARAVSRVLGVHGQKIHNYAVMAGTATFEGPMPERVYGIWQTVRKIQSYRTPVFSRGHVVSICSTLERRRIKGGYWAAQRHVERLRKKAAETTSRPSSG